ncbi:MAG TPA: GntG family PLP-dependent aldolase [Gemmatimonadales bacterium]|nr:GntG family PLP-dependent aldolase [Gemmatimonadales bacterium]
MSAQIIADLRSDTVTRPVPGMREAIASAVVGDDVLEGDPTVRSLEDQVCSVLNKDRALFFPSGTMANLAALWLQAERGTEVLLDSECHIYNWEVAGAASIAGVQPRPVIASNGIVMQAADLQSALKPASSLPRTSLVCVENTHNGAGGAVSDAAFLQAIREVADGQGLPVHMDGARLWNAAVALNVTPASLVEHADTVMVSFSKGLGAPVGAALAGSERAMERAWEVRKRLGGGMRQSGVLAAACIYGLEHHMEQLADDHANAALLATLVGDVDGVRVVQPQTNILMVDLPASLSGPEVARRAAERGVLISPWNATRIRAVTHLDVSREAVAAAGAVLRDVLAEQ